MSFEPNYSKYSLTELYDCLNRIDKVKYPERFERIKVEVAKRPASDLNDSDEENKQLSPKKKYRNCAIILVILILTYLFSGKIWFKGVQNISMQSNSEIYWVIIFGLSVWASYYIKKYFSVIHT
mgnify:CR=1 FL=1